jgi:signal peptidase I
VNNAPAPSPYGKGFTFDNYGPIYIPKAGEFIQLNAQNIADWKIFIEREGHKVNYDVNTITIDGNAATEYKVQRNYCFGMGDNRDDSKDSRDWGFIPYENVVGTPIMVYWSWSPEVEMKNLGEKLKSIRWSRLGTFIR